MEINELTAVCEAVIFAAGDAIAKELLVTATGSDLESVNVALEVLKDRYEDEQSGLRLVQLEDKVQITTKEESAPAIKLALEIVRDAPLSQAALEVLAVISYNQPVTRSFVEQVRGVDCVGVINTLVAKKLVDESGRLDLPGRPIAYITTDNFLRCFGISSIDELPELTPEVDTLVE